MTTPRDSTEFRIGRSHGDIVYHHVAGRDYKLDPRYAVCQSSAEADMIRVALNIHVRDCGLDTADDFKLAGLRW
jgi:hypothetical protein